MSLWHSHKLNIKISVGQNPTSISGSNEPIYKIGDRIGIDYEIYRIFGGEGKSGMGIVYICYNHKFKSVVALKTFQNKFLCSKDIKDSFKKEAYTWVKLERHPYIVKAELIEQLDYRIFVACEFIPTDEEGRNTLTHYLNETIPLEQALKWSIQFCYGMDHAYSKGVTPHRDIKPDNIMVTNDGTIKITDFGLSGLWNNGEILEEIGGYKDKDRNGLTFLKAANGKVICGTPPWMAPEQFDGYSDVRSDIYSFGIVMYQMLNKGELPIYPTAGSSWEKVHKTSEASIRNTVLSPVIKRSLNKVPYSRYNNFSELREDLERIYKKTIGDKIPSLPDIDKFEVWEYSNKGLSFANLGLFDEAINEFKKAINLNPEFVDAHHNLAIAFYKKGIIDEAILEFKNAVRVEPFHAKIHTGLGVALKDLGSFDEAIFEFREALRLNPNDIFAHNNLGVTLKAQGLIDDAIYEFQEALKLQPKYAEVYHNIGNILFDKGQLDEAINNYETALKLNPDFVKAYNGLGIALHKLSRLEESISCFDKVLALDDKNAFAWAHKGFCLENNGQFTQAIECYDKAINFKYEQSDELWNIKGCILKNFQRIDDAIDCYNKSIEINPKYIPAWTNKGIAFELKGNVNKAIDCYEKAIELNPQWSSAWYNKGVCLMNIGNNEKAIYCFNESIKNFDKTMEPVTRYAAAWLNKALCEEKIMRRYDAVNSYKNFLDIAPPQFQRHISYAQKRLQEININK